MARTLKTLLLMMAAAAATTLSHAQQTVYVDHNNCPGPGNGTPVSPYCKIQDAVCSIRNTGGGTVSVKPGTYNEAVRMFPSVDLVSTDGPAVTIIDPTGKPCILSDCSASATQTHCSAVYFPSGANGRLEGFRLTKGQGIQQTCSGTCNVEIGGGLTIFNSSPTITRNEIVTNTISQISSKTTAFYGGGVYIQADGASADEARPTITLNTVDGNVASPPSGTSRAPTHGIGGGIYAGFNSAPVISKNTVTNNKAGDPTLSNQDTGGGGMALYSGRFSDSLRVQGNLVKGNHGTDYAGGVAAGEFDSNGDGVWEPSRGIVENNLIVENDAFDGGGIQGNTSQLVFRNNTVSDNTALNRGTGNAGKGGGVSLGVTAGSAIQVALVNNIIAFNTAQGDGASMAGQGGGLFVDQSNPTVGNSDLNGNVPTNVGGGKSDADYIGRSGTVSVNPLFVNRTAGSRDYHLQRTSPVVDVGDGANAPAADYDGAPRPQDANGDGISVVDMGAYEFSPDFDGDGVPDWQDADMDNDGVLNALDCRPLDATQWSVPAEVDSALVWSSKTVFGWTAAAQTKVYDVYRGSAPSGTLFAFNETALTCRVGTTSATDTATPPSGYYYYLVAARNDCGEGILGRQTGGALRPNPSPCP